MEEKNLITEAEFYNVYPFDLETAQEHPEWLCIEIMEEVYE